MNVNISAAQAEQYRRDGFLIIREFLTPDELDHWRGAVEQAIAARGRRRILGRDGTEQDDGGYYDNVFTQRVNLWQDSDAVRAIMLDEQLGKAAADLAGVDGIRIWHDQALFKPRWGNPTAWHLDNPYWSFYSPDAISIWVALDDATVENGCLAFLPGTHTEGEFERNVGISQNFSALFDAYPEWADRQPVMAEMKAGDASFHNGLTAHGAGVNMTPHSRRAMTCAYMPDGSTFNGQQNILPRERMDRMAVGDPLDDDSFNPLIFSRTREVDLAPLRKT